MKKYVITGGPGIGKTTIIELLASKGYVVIPEVARLITAEEKLKDSNIIPWKNLEKYQEKVAERQLKLEAQVSADIIFLDRGLIDGYGYCKLNNVIVPKPIMENGKKRYEKVFVLEPLPAYKNDETRFEDREEAKKIHQAIIDAYKEFGYQIISIPVLPPEERVDFILKNI